MSDVKWIKIVVDIFNDEKILLIESMPDADAIMCIWFKLLCLAGKVGTNGVLLMNDRIAFTDEMLATIFRRNINTVRFALSTFEKFGMIEIIDGTITIPNWFKHQNMDVIETKRKYQREYMQKKRENQRLNVAHSPNETNCKTNSESNRKSNVSRAEKEREIEREKEIEIDSSLKEKKHKFGQFNNVLLTDEEYEKLKEKFSDYEAKIENFSEGLALKGYVYKSHYLAILKWNKEQPKKQNTIADYEADTHW